MNSTLLKSLCPFRLLGKIANLKFQVRNNASRNGACPSHGNKKIGPQNISIRIKLLSHAFPPPKEVLTLNPMSVYRLSIQSNDGLFRTAGCTADCIMYTAGNPFCSLLDRRYRDGATFVIGCGSWNFVWM